MKILSKQIVGSRQQSHCVAISMNNETKVRQKESYNHRTWVCHADIDRMMEDRAKTCWKAAMMEPGNAKR